MRQDLECISVTIYDLFIYFLTHIHATLVLCNLQIKANQFFNIRFDLLLHFFNQLQGMAQGCITGIASVASILSPLVFTPLTGNLLIVNLNKSFISISSYF